MSETRPSVELLVMSVFDDLSFTVDFSISGVKWEVTCAIHQEVRRYPSMSYKTVDVFSVESARCPSQDTELTGEQWENVLEALGLTKSFYKKVNDQLFLIAMAMMQDPGQA